MDSQQTEPDLPQARTLPGKPVSPYHKPEMTSLPELTPWRRLARWLLRSLARLLIWLWTKPCVNGLEKFPRQGPALVVTNHLGDADAILGLAYLPAQVDALAKIDLYFEYPFLGWLMGAYGVIWVHRGQPDRRALRAALQGLRQGRLVGIAPEGHESRSGALEEGNGGAAFLALRAGVSLVPVTYTGTENARIYGNMKRLRRTPVSLTVGPAFTLDSAPNWREGVAHGTHKIMHILAEQLPPEYRGAYR